MKSRGHFCKFMKTCKTLDTLYPPQMKFSKIRRKFRELLLLSEENGRRCYMPQGNAGYIYQKEKQLTQAFHIIHPYSKFCELWQTLAIIEFCVLYPVRSFAVTQFPKVFLTPEYQVPSLLSDLFQTADVWLRFNIGYMDKQRQEVVLESRKVVLHTLKRWSFYADALVSFPYDFLVYLYSPKRVPNSAFHYCVLMKIIKTYTISRYIAHLGKIYNWGELWVLILWSVFLNFYISHFISCAFHLIVRETFFSADVPASPGLATAFFYYVRIFYVITCSFFGVQGVGDSPSLDTLQDRVLFAFMIFVQNFNSIIFYGTFVNLLAFIRGPRVLFDEMKQEVQKFLAQENLPKRIHLRAMKYLDFRYCHTYFNEQMILDTLSPPLRREVLKFLCFNLLKRPHSIFNILPDEMVTDLCLLMRLEYFLPGDAVFRIGDKSKHLYFLYSGSVAVYNHHGKEVIHWYEGQQFGMSSFMNTPEHPVTVVALEMTELYLLRFKNFLEVVGQDPELLRKVRETALLRIRRVTSFLNFEIKEPNT